MAYVVAQENFKKLMKPPKATLILQFIDDLINIRLSFDECVKNVITSIKLRNSLGLLSIQTNLYSYENEK